MALGYLESKFESTPGNESNTPTLSTKQAYFPFIEAKPDQGVSHLERDDENRNQDQPLPVLPNEYEPEWSMEERAYPDTLGFLLKLTLGAPTTTAGNGVITDPDLTVIPTGAYRHVWTAPFGPSGASPLTAQMQFAYTDQSFFWKLKGAACSELELSNPDDGSRIAASGRGLYGARISDPSLTPAYEALSIRPFTRANLTLPSWLSGTGTHENFGLTIANPVEAVRSMGIASRSPDVMEKGEDLITVSGSLPQRQLDADDYDALVNATAFAATARYVSESIIASAYPYKLFVAMPNCQYVGGEIEALTNKRRHGAEFNWKATYAGSASVVISLVNATPNYV